MNKEETLKWFKGKKEGLKIARGEIKILKDRIEEEIRIINMEIKEIK